MLALAAPRFALPILIALGLGLFVLNLGGYPFYTKGEPREALSVLAIVSGAGVILPLRAGVEIPSKPPLMHWMAALVSLAAGTVNEWTVRLPSAIFAIAGMLACYFYVGVLFDGLSGFLAALMLATSFHYLQAGSGARVDMTLTFFTEVAFFEFLLITEGLSRRRLVLYLALVLAVLSKGPVGLVLPAAVALGWLVIQGRWSALGRIGLLWGIALVIVIDGGWYLAAALQRGAPFVHKQILAENFFRFFHSAAFQEGHTHPFYYLEAALLAGFMPWTLIAPAVALEFVRCGRPRNPRLRYLAVWCLVVLGFYSLAQSKRGAYLLPLYPALVAIFGVAMAEAASVPGAITRWIGALTKAAGILLLCAGLLAVAGMVMLAVAPEPIARLMDACGWTVGGLMPALVREAVRYRTLAVPIALGTTIIGVVMLRLRPLADRMVIGIATGFGCIVMLANLVVVPAQAETLSLKNFALAARGLIDHRPAAYLGGLNYEVAFYTGLDIPLAKHRGPMPPDFLIAWRRIYEAMPPAVRARYTVALASNPTELDGTGVMLLLRHAPAKSRPAAAPGLAPSP